MKLISHTCDARYYALASRRVVLLLVGGDKRRQRADIDAALKY